MRTRREVVENALALFVRCVEASEAGKRVEFVSENGRSTVVMPALDCAYSRRSR